MPTATTKAPKIFHLLGHPVGHSLSPVIHGKAYELLAIRASYTTLDCPDRQSVASAVEKLRRGEVTGLNVTVPHKKLALELSDEVDESAREVQAANVLARTPEGRVRAYNTDAPALAEELRRLTSRKGGALILGTGGAALAALVSAKLAGFAPIFVSGRRYLPDLDPKSWPEYAALERFSATPVLWPTFGEAEFRAAERESAVVIQATSAGMKGAESGENLASLLCFDSARAYYDLVYNPRETPFLNGARAVGAPNQGGLGMLVGQAALALEIWLGERPPLEPLKQAAEAELRARTAR
jgi:shikimate dehydrogenase